MERWKNDFPIQIEGNREQQPKQQEIHKEEDKKVPKGVNEKESENIKKKRGKDQESPPTTFTTISTTTTSTTTTSKEKKRNQVPKACSNCRRDHAKCGTERPCARCVLNKMEDTCIDLPRRKKNLISETSIHHEGIESTTPGSYNIIGGGSNVNIGKVEEKSLTKEDVEMELLEKRIQQVYLHNRELENRINFLDLQTIKETQNLQFMSGQLGHSFQHDLQSPSDWSQESETAISVWKKENDPRYGMNGVLMECNENFLNLVGYSLEILQNHFTLDRLNEKLDFIRSNLVNRIEIRTSNGWVKVVVACNPITNQFSEVKYFLLHFIREEEFIPSQSSINIT